MLVDFFLHLKAARESIDKTGNFAQPDDFSVGDVSDVALSKKRQQVMLAQRKEIDVFDHHHLAVGHIKKSAVDQAIDVHVIAGRQFPQ